MKPVVGALDDEAAMDRCDTVTVSLADHTHLAGYMSTSSRRSDRTSPVRSPPNPDGERIGEKLLHTARGPSGTPGPQHPSGVPEMKA